MRQSDVGWGVLAGAGLAALGLVFYRWGLSYPLLNLYGQMTFWLGVPAVFNLIHSLLGYGELAKNLAFIGAVGVWLALHPFLAWAFRRVWWVALGLAFGLYTLLGGWWAGLVYTALLGLILWGRSRRAPVRLEIEDPARRPQDAGAASSGSPGLEPSQSPGPARRPDRLGQDRRSLLGDHPAGKALLRLQKPRPLRSQPQREAL